MINIDDTDTLENLERKIVSIMLHDSQAAEEIISRLENKDFNNEYFKKIFFVCNELKNAGKQIEPNLVIRYFDTHANYHFPDYPDLILSLYNEYTTSIDILAYIDSIKSASIKKQLIQLLSSVPEYKFDQISFDKDIFDLQQKFLSITGSKKNIRLKNMNEITKMFEDKFNKILSNNNEYSGTRIGIKEIDDITNGFQPGDLIILAARPGVGKTALSLNFLLNAAKEIKIKNENIEKNSKKDVVVMFSLEMGVEQLCQRLISAEGLINLSFKNLKKISAIDINSYHNSIKKINELPILIDDSSDLSIIDIQSQLKQLTSNYNIKLVIVDYLQLLKTPKGSYNLNRQQEVAFISRTLKSIARDPEINTPIIAVAQLSRAAEQRDRPMLSDLRESGAIEQDADIVTFINPEKNNEQDNENKTEFLNNQDLIVDFSVEKHRNGPTGTIKLKFQKTFGKYTGIKQDKN